MRPPAHRRPRASTPASVRYRQAETARKRERLAAEEAAARCAAELWRNASRTDPAHPYLVAKGLEPFGIRQAGSDLIVPMIDPGFRLWNVQRIRPDGFKLFAKNGRTAGLFWPHGVHLIDGRPSAGPLVIGESLENGDGLEPSDWVGVASLWEKPDVFHGLTTWHLHMVQQALAAGDWRESVQAKDWVGRLVAKVAGLSADTHASLAQRLAEMST